MVGLPPCDPVGRASSQCDGMLKLQLTRITACVKGGRPFVLRHMMPSWVL